MKCLIWNLEWTVSESNRGKIIKQIVDDLNPDVICFTEAYPAIVPDNGYIITSDANYGYENTGDRRKVILWSKNPWKNIDQYGSKDIPGGRFISGITNEIRFIGVCIPWKDAHVNTGMKNRKIWEDHSNYLISLNIITKKYLLTENKICMVGDFNQRIPRLYTPEDIFEKLMKIIQSDFNIITANLLDENGKLLIDHVAVSNTLKGEFENIIPKTTKNGFKLSDHSGLIINITE